MSLFAFDDLFRKQGLTVIAGIDEAGRGSLAGPVVAGCVCFLDNEVIEGINDSKKLTLKQRETLFNEIRKHAAVGIGIVDENIIDQINILEATRLAMLRAFKDLNKNVDLILIDALEIPELQNIKQKAIIKADQKSASVAAASIIAKVTRDLIMNSYHQIYCNYGFNQHKGYATKQHLEAIKKFRPCPIHRQSFSPVRELMLF